MSEKAGVLIIGAGPAGLAAGQALRQHGIDFEIVERGQTIAPAWHRHYDRLHLHTAKQFSALPGLPFPADVPTYPPRGRVIDYLNAYAARFDLQPRFGIEVLKLEKIASGWRARTSQGDIEARTVVLATGLNAVPVRPSWPGLEHYTGELLHSSEYVNGARWAGKRVLVVGAGNSGAEIALDLVERRAKVDLCVRRKLHFTRRDTLGLPAPLPSLVLTKLPLPVADRIAGAVLRMTIGDLSRWGIEAPSYGPIRGIVEHGRIPVIDVGTLAMIKQRALRVRPAIERFDEGGAFFVDEKRGAYDAVILATGYKPALERLLDGAEALLDSRGRALRDGAEAREGLYLVGFVTPATGTLREIGLSARRAAAHIAAAHSRR